MATINYGYYTGTDRYSDGDIENKLMQFAAEKKTPEDLPDEEVSYPVLYHLSHLRENIINWYPIDSEQTVLEIGAGCGAITGALCEKAKRVVVVELSKRRALINYTRNEHRENLEIMVGNLNDIIFEEKFDFVIFNGVFEYGLSFIEGEQPYIRFLKMCKNYLKKSGKILVAIENRLGIKYFTGAPEDHTKNYLLGLNEYEGNTSVRTFSKSEWKNMLEQCGLLCKFYYPYPDYKFPEEIYTDESITSGRYGKPYLNYDPDRFAWMDEYRLTKTMEEEGIVSSFANSFFLEISRDGSFSDIEYSKMSCDRRRDRRILTVIHNNHGKKWVEKSAADREAGAHIRKLCENSLAAGTKEKVFRLPGEWKDEKVRFAYLTEKSLEEKVLSVLKTDGKEQAFGLIRDFFDAYFERYQKVMFTPGKEFREIFGETGCENAWEGIRGGNLDLVLDNVYCQQERYCIIDCEWIFDFELPVKFIIWRSLNDFCIKHEETELLDWFGITEDEIRQFKEWNVHFVYKWLKANGTERFAKAKKYVSMDYMAGLYRKENYLSCSLYYDCGEGYSEEQKVFAEVAMQDRHFEVNFDLSCVEGIRRMRFDPEEGRACRCCLDKNEWGFLPVNAQKKENEWDVFLTGDPIYEAVPGENSVIRRVTVSGEIRYTDFNEWERQLMEIQEEMRCRMEEERNRYQEEMRQQKAREEVLQKELSDSRSKLQHTGELLGVSEAKAAELAAMAAHQREILDSIYNSRGWKALSFVRRMVKRGESKEYD